MTDLRQAAQQALEAWDDPLKDLRDLCVAMDAIRTALEQKKNQDLTNLLCRVHRDGGHYIAEHGLQKAIEDADIKISKLNAMSDAQRKPLTDEMVHKAMFALNTASYGELQPTFEEMKAAIEAAHNIKEGT